MSDTEQLASAVLEILSPAEVKERMDANQIVLIDVRTPNEYVVEHIPGALLFPLSFFDAQKLPSQEGKPIVFHCGSGKRSRIVAERCAAAGITQLAHMDGGFAAWKAAGFPHVSVDPATGGFVRQP